jgi:hypothetical protein
MKCIALDALLDDSSTSLGLFVPVHQSGRHQNTASDHSFYLEADKLPYISGRSIGSLHLVAWIALR